MIKAGVRKDIAERAYNGANTPKAQIIREARQQALKNLEAAGISREQVFKHVTETIGQRVGIGAGPSGPSPVKTLPGRGGKIPTDLLSGLNRFRQVEPAPAPKPPIKPGKIKIHESARPNARVERAATLASEAGFNVAILPAEKFRDKRTAAVYFVEQDIIGINAEAPWWRDPEGNARYNHDEGWISSNDADQVTHHEIGHGNHFRKIGRTAEKKAEMQQAVDPEMAEMIKVNVSKYATKNRGEFVAEVYAGLKAGKVYPPRVMDYYTLMGGPTP
ncbi:MAG: hypothetical protein KGR26_08375 [Cyanobacteria bacterium REEB65]|nr:hypothetical protein [Cyanobacteria bacterium REEB65]